MREIVSTLPPVSSCSMWASDRMAMEDARIAAGVTAHAVAHGDEMLAGEGGILIVRAHGAHIGHRGGIQEQRL